ncbi:MAG TPA: energy transducer TonB [Blastocatellia bacterium]|nr:energy transducer TonB [Blastocatellia bacterium]
MRTLILLLTFGLAAPLTLFARQPASAGEAARQGEAAKADSTKLTPCTPVLSPAMLEEEKTGSPVQRPLRVALIGLAPPASNSVAEARAIETYFKDALARDARVVMTEPSQIRTAVAGIKYDGSINMSKDEARRLGSAIGCDFFIVGKAEVLTRSERENEEHEEALVGVMVVDSRSGALAVFDFLNERAPTKGAALAAVIKSLGGRVAAYVERMNEFRARRESPPGRADSSHAGGAEASGLERVEDMPDAESAVGADFKAPQFLNRVKPEYTAEADRADIAATVEARAVFRANGEIGQVEITRWAGFGLDEAAERAIRQLKFKPAARNGRPVSVRASVRYNFRRVSDAER